jgi:hypothetical protein
MVLICIRIVVVVVGFMNFYVIVGTRCLACEQWTRRDVISLLVNGLLWGHDHKAEIETY